jgi:PAS domain S-box-containing protein
MRNRGVYQSGSALLAWMEAAAAGPTVGAQWDPSAAGVWVLALLLGLLAVSLAVRRTTLQRELRTTAARFHVGGLPGASSSPVGAPDPLQRISVSLSSYRESLTCVSAGQSEEMSRRIAAHSELREVEERYRLAVRGADDAIWEWDLKTDRVHFSARWKILLGYAENELSDRIDEWSKRIHPDDSERALLELRAHLEGRSMRLDSEHRLRHRDGSWRWVNARAMAVRDAAGEPSRLVGLVSDISARKQVERSLVEIAEGLSAVTGEECLRKLVHSFAAVLGVREAFVCECSGYPTTRVRMLARWKAGEFARCVEFDLAGTACEDVIREGRTVFAPRDAGERWALEKQYERESYLGIACLDSSGRVIGHVACADDKPMREELPHQAILKIFAMRAAIELERSGLDRQRQLLSKSHLEWPLEFQGRA